MKSFSNPVLKRRVLRSSSVACAVALALATLPRAQAATQGPGSPLGGPITVSAPATNGQGSSSVAMDATGDFVVAWESYDQAGSKSEGDIYAQRYGSDGAPEGSAFLVNTYTSGNQDVPAVAMDATGDFVVAWQSFDQATSTSGDDIYAQRYGSDGVPEGSAFLVNAYTSGEQARPAVAMDAAGDFVVAWQSYGQAGSRSGYDVYAQRYGSDGAPLGSNFLVNTYTIGDQEAPAVAMDAAGDFVVAWQSFDQAGSVSDFDIYAQRYGSDGAPLGSNFLVNAYTSGDQEYPAVAMDATGDFVVAWKSYGQAGSSSEFDIYAQRYGSDGAPLGSNFLVNTYTSGNQEFPAVAMDAAGDFVVAWKGYNSSTTFYGIGIYAQRYAADGAPEGSNFPVPGLTPTDSSVGLAFDATPSVALDAVGDFVIGQDGYYTAYSGTHKYHFADIMAQRYQGESAASPDVAVTGVSSDSTVTPGSPFSVSFEVVNRTPPPFETTDAYLNRFIGAVSYPTITVTLPADALSLPAGGANWNCTGNRTVTLTCTYAGIVGSGQYSPPLMVGLVAPDVPGTIVYGATVPGSSEPPFTGSVAVANPPGGSSGGFGWIELLGLLGFGVLARRHRGDPVRPRE